MDKCKTLQSENIELAENLKVETTTCEREVKGMFCFDVINTVTVYDVEHTRTVSHILAGYTIILYQVEQRRCKRRICWLVL